MLNVSQKHEEIYDFFHANQLYANRLESMKSNDAYAAYYTSMYLVRDTADALLVHRKSGFSENSCLGYIELWGILQAITVQQDAIKELAKSVGVKVDKEAEGHYGRELRKLRHKVAGHPAHSGGDSRSFLSRKFGSYDHIKYELYLTKSAEIQHPHVPLGSWLDEYDIEAGRRLDEILTAMKDEVIAREKIS